MKRDKSRSETDFGRPGSLRGSDGIAKTPRKLGIFALQRAISLFRNKMLAETARFELAVAVTRYDGLANRWFQPLTHVSRCAWLGRL